MSKSVKRVRAALEAAGIATDLREMDQETRTAAQAAEACGCVLDQIVKSIVFLDEDADRAVLFLTAGGNRVDGVKAATLAGAPLGKADADLIRRQTGFAIGGVAPVGHLSPIRTFFDPRLLDFPLIWAAAGTPRHVFSVEPRDLARISDAEVTDFTSENH